MSVLTENINTYRVSVRYPSAAIARIVATSVDVDKELTNTIERKISVENNTIFAEFKSRDLKLMRVALTGFFSALRLSTETVQRFGAPAAPALQET